MLSPYNDPEESDDSSVTSSESRDSNETDGTSVSDRLKQDGRMQALDQWRTHALSWIDGPGRAPVGEGPGLPPVTGLQNTELQITEQRVTHTLMVDSLDRDQRVYPLPTQFKLRLPRTYRNITRIDIVQVKMLSGFYAFSEAKGNTALTIHDTSNNTLLTVTVPEGTYSIQQLVDSIVLPVGFDITYSCTTGHISICGPVPFQILPPPAPPLPATLPTSDWGLAWNLGFGGPATTISSNPSDCSGGNAVTASCFPRLTTDYIYLRLNDTEFMNSVDHTDVEDTAVSQDPTGQVSHYFAKLLLNDFGCYAQTMIESPKLFAPVLGRLDRLSFTWVDRAGNPLVGPDAASCDWHMTLRIVEIQDRASQGSTLVRAPQPS